MQRQVEAQFDDDKYMDVSKNQGKLIEGVKHQYQKMKQSIYASIQNISRNVQTIINF